ncbi:hypothetical protein AWM75_04660 [Aerococcus urinaehominis]|uniref:Uncharacterized protein n=1 Tax=Aerococcus urinaehominis TaxID=128944 RepID=A0A0X8FLL4_9LACT|nr:anti-sigma factor domain-containing protein [Aerococcus urinaehominis]AMB99334.1 hypothetical protein AWM75_04660 [Aerococcus urinaehominis]SDM20847.1 hypothetical protein SAMN04487985_10860 [Aerococcus urinaehominis]
MTYYKGLVTSIADNYALVLVPGASFKKIKLKEDLTVGQAILFTPEDLYSPQLTSRQSAKNRRLVWLRPLMAVASILLLMVGGWWLLGHSTDQVQAAISLGIETNLTVEVDEENQIIAITDGQADLSVYDSFLGRPLPEFYGEMTKFIDQQKQADIVIASTDKAPNYQQILQQLGNNQSKTNLIAIQGQLTDYQSAKASQRHLTNYLLDQAGIKLWNQTEGEKLTAAEKQKRLGNKARFIQIGSDKSVKEIRSSEIIPEDSRSSTATSGQANSAASSNVQSTPSQLPTEAPIVNEPGAVSDDDWYDDDNWDTDDDYDDDDYEIESDEDYDDDDWDDEDD